MLSDIGTILTFLHCFTYVASLDRLPSLSLHHSNCHLRCHHGYDRNIEGETICKCYNPCSSVMCFGQRKCVVKVDVTCSHSKCKPRASCQPIREGQPRQPAALRASRAPIQSPVYKALRVHRDRVSRHRVPQTPRPDVCYRRAIPTRGCTRTKRRWFFDVSAGRCRKFSSCPGIGNNFQRRKGCVRTCGKKSRRRKTRKCTLKNMSRRCTKSRNRKRQRSRVRKTKKKSRTRRVKSRTKSDIEQSNKTIDRTKPKNENVHTVRTSIFKITPQKHTKQSNHTTFIIRRTRVRLRSENRTRNS